jgi:pSer/pThr/pTyr-binding forkhead associated (FHA) protein
VSPLVLTLLQLVFLLLLYLFVARAVRAVLRDLRATPATSPSRPRPSPRTESPRRKRPPPRELVVHVPDGRPRVVPLDGREVTFGRAETSTVMLVDPYTSEHHARVYRQGDEWYVADLGSTNGTYLNQQKVTAPTPLSAGDQVGIGKTTVEVRR